MIPLPGERELIKRILSFLFSFNDETDTYNLLIPHETRKYCGTIKYENIPTIIINDVSFISYEYFIENILPLIKTTN